MYHLSSTTVKYTNPLFFAEFQLLGVVPFLKRRFSSFGSFFCLVLNVLLILEMKKSTNDDDVVSALHHVSTGKVNLEDVDLQLPPTKEGDDDKKKTHHGRFSLEMQHGLGDELEVLDKIPVPNMWTKDYIGLYCQYAAVGKCLFLYLSLGSSSYFLF
jgi:hypothetical protein